MEYLIQNADQTITQQNLFNTMKHEASTKHALRLVQSFPENQKSELGISEKQKPSFVPLKSQLAFHNSQQMHKPHGCAGQKEPLSTSRSPLFITCPARPVFLRLKRA